MLSFLFIYFFQDRDASKSSLKENKDLTQKYNLRNNNYKSNKLKDGT